MDANSWGKTPVATKKIAVPMTTSWIWMRIKTQTIAASPKRKAVNSNVDPIPAQV
jgi:hypothetical protein